MNRLLTIAIATLLLSGCIPEKAVISDLEEDKVIVQWSGVQGERLTSVIWAEAERGCAIHGKVPVEISSRCAIPSAYTNLCDTYETLFACQDLE